MLLCMVIMTSYAFKSSADESFFSSITSDIITEYKAITESFSEQPEVNYRTIEWTELMPKDDLEAIMNQPDYIEDIVDGINSAVTIEVDRREAIILAISSASDNDVVLIAGNGHEKYQIS